MKSASLAALALAIVEFPKLQGSSSRNRNENRLMKLVKYDSNINNIYLEKRRANRVPQFEDHRNLID